MWNLGGGEVLVLLLLGLLVVGPQRLPIVGRQVARALAEIRRVSRGFQEEFRAAVEDPAIETSARLRGVELNRELLEPDTPLGSDKPEDQD